MLERGPPHLRMKRFAPLARIAENDMMIKPVKGFSNQEWDLAL